MGSLWFDGFESYNDNADANTLINLRTFGMAFSTSYGRRSSRGMRNDSWNKYYIADLSNNPSTVIVGIAFKATSMSSYDANRMLFRLSGPSGVHVRLIPNGSGTIDILDGSNSIIGTSSGHTLSVGIWYYVEMKAYIHDSAGTVEVKVNEIQVLNLTGQDTANGTATIDEVRLGLPSSGGSVDYDDFYICDISGSKNNDFLGDIRVDILRPNAAGAYTDFTPSAGANYANVDETYGPDDDTTYNDGANVGDQDSYQMPDLPSPPSGTTIHGVKSQITVCKTDAGAMECKILTRAGITDDLGDAISLSDSFTTLTKIFEDNPDDAAAWADADVNGMEIGVKITA